MSEIKLEWIIEKPCIGCGDMSEMVFKGATMCPDCVLSALEGSAYASIEKHAQNANLEVLELHPVSSDDGFYEFLGLTVEFMLGGLKCETYIEAKELEQIDEG